MSKPTAYKDLSDTERAALEMARRIGLPIEIYALGISDWAPRSTGFENKPFQPGVAYRIKRP